MLNGWQAVDVNPMEMVVAAFVRLAFPIWFAIYLVRFAFRIGRKRKRDRCAAAAPAQCFAKLSESLSSNRQN